MHPPGTAEKLKFLKPMYPAVDDYRIDRSHVRASIRRECVVALWDRHSELRILLSRGAFAASATIAPTRH